MTVYLLESDTLIDFSKRYEPTSTWILRSLGGSDVIAVCAVNVAEFFNGVVPHQRPMWDNFFATLTYFDISLAAATRAGMYRYDFARRGIQLHTPDTLVAAVAYENGAIVVTSNVKDYPMADVQTLDPRI